MFLLDITKIMQIPLKESPLKREFYCWLAVFILVGNFVSSDTIYLKNGKELEGVIHDSGGPEIQIEMSGGALSVKRSEISEIKAGKKALNLVTQAKSEETAGNYKHAIELYFKAGQQTNGESDSNEILTNKKKSVGKISSGY